MKYWFNCKIWNRWHWSAYFITVWIQITVFIIRLCAVVDWLSVNVCECVWNAMRKKTVKYFSQQKKTHLQYVFHLHLTVGNGFFRSVSHHKHHISHSFDSVVCNLSLFQMTEQYFYFGIMEKWIIWKICSSLCLHLNNETIHEQCIKTNIPIVRKGLKKNSFNKKNQSLLDNTVQVESNFEKKFRKNCWIQK